MPITSVEGRTDTSSTMITFYPSNLRSKFNTWFYHELKRQESVLDEAAIDNITSWDEGEGLFGRVHNALRRLLNRVYNELDKKIFSDRYNRYHAAHRFKVKLDIFSPVLNSAKRAQIHMAERTRFNSDFDFHTVWTLKNNVLKCMLKAYDVPYVTNAKNSH